MWWRVKTNMYEKLGVILWRTVKSHMYEKSRGNCVEEGKIAYVLKN